MNFFEYFLNLSLQRVILVEPLVHLVDNPFPLVLSLRLMLVEPKVICLVGLTIHDP